MAIILLRATTLLLPVVVLLVAAFDQGDAASFKSVSKKDPANTFPSPLFLSLNDEFTLFSRLTTTTETQNNSSSTRRLSAHESGDRPTKAADKAKNELAHSNVRRSEQEHIKEGRKKREEGTELKAFYYFIQALGNSELNGCKNPQPSFTATCPEGAFIVSQSSKSQWTSRLDCKQTAAYSISCTPKLITEETQADIDLDDQNGVVVACYASDEDLLQVSVDIHPGSYFCDKALEVRSDPPTVIAGGNVYQTVAIQKQCWSKADDSESWIFVEPACGNTLDTTTAHAIGRDHQTLDTSEEAEGGMLQYTEIPIQTTGGGETSVGREYSSISTTTIAHCQMQDNCTAQLECSPRCTGKSSCHVELPGFMTTSTPATTTVDPPEACVPRDFAMNLRNGQACEFNLMCGSGVCVHGACVTVQKEDHETCEEDSDCISMACGKYPEIDDASIESSTIPDKTCCPSGGTFGHEGESFCTGSQPVEGACHEDAMCHSDICVFNTCRPKLLDDGFECEESNDCLVGHCGHYHDQDSTICCVTGDSIFLSQGLMCSNRPPGDICEDTVNSLCQSNICVEGVCQAIEQEVGGICDNHFDCMNDACALAFADPSAPYICCHTNEYVFLSSTDEVLTATVSTRAIDAFPISGLRVCTGQPLGASCGLNDDIDDMCMSGLCIAGACHDERQPAGATCANDSDCANHVCALSSLDDDASNICCPSKDHKHVYTNELKDVCTGQPLGAQCGPHNIDVVCESGNCVDSACIPMPMDEP